MLKYFYWKIDSYKLAFPYYTVSISNFISLDTCKHTIYANMPCMNTQYAIRLSYSLKLTNHMLDLKKKYSTYLSNYQLPKVYPIADSGKSRERNAWLSFFPFRTFQVFFLNIDLQIISVFFFPNIILFKKLIIS